MYHIPISEKMLIMTLSYRKSDGIIWKPILDDVKKSLVF